ARAQTSRDLTQTIFGSVLSARHSDMIMTIIISSIVLGCVSFFYEQLLISTFDATMSAAYGLLIKWIYYGIMLLLTLTTVASVQKVGVVLVVAMLITPASTAYLLTNRFLVMIILAAFFGAFSAVIGLYISSEYNLVSGAVIVLAATIMFLLAFIFSPKQGLLWRSLRSQKQKANV